MLTVDSQGTLFWTSAGPQGSVQSLPLGSVVAEPVATGQTDAWAIAVDDAAVAWTTGPTFGDLSEPGNVRFQAKSGALNSFTTAAANIASPVALALNATNLYWISGGNPNIHRRVRSGATTFSAFMGASDGNALAATNSDIHFVIYTGQWRTLPAAFTNTMTVPAGPAVTQEGYSATVFNNDVVYMSTRQGHLYRRSQVNTWEVTTDVDPSTTGPMFAFALAADATHVYYTTAYTTGSDQKYLVRVSTAQDSTPELLAPATTPRGVAVYGDFVYWVEQDANAGPKLLKMRKPGT